MVAKIVVDKIHWNRRMKVCPKTIKIAERFRGNQVDLHSCFLKREELPS